LKAIKQLKYKTFGMKDENNESLAHWLISPWEAKNHNTAEF
jgi:hypothetical protein